MSDRRPRWRASRAGIINIFEYGDQVFEFGDGRLLLRGPNGSGKSKAMELLFPFLFEGDMSAVKLDPFGKQARKMKWNLLMDGKYVHRIGYAWVELRHDDPRHTPQYATFGVCLDAHKEWDDVKPRFFYVPGLRVGDDFQLIGTDKRPLNRDQLRDLVSGLAGETFVQKNHYQERLNQVVFGYRDVKRLNQQIRLQRTLRRPQLSDSLDEQLLNNLLSEALPEIDTELLERSSKRLDQIDESRVRLETLKRHEKAVADFAVTYASYGRVELRERRDALREAAADLDHAQTAYDACAAENEQVQSKLAETAAAVIAAQGKLERLRGAYETLLSSPEMKAAAELSRARERVEVARDALNRHNEQLTTAGEELARKQSARNQQDELLRNARGRFSGALERLGEDAEKAGIEVHNQFAGSLRGETPVGPVLEQLDRAVRERRAGIEEVRRRRDFAENKERIAHRLRNGCDEAREQADEAQSERVNRETELAAARGRLAEQVATWAERLQELKAEEELLTRLDEAADEAGAPEAARLADLAAPIFAAAETLYARIELELDRRSTGIAAERAPLEAERAALEAAVDPQPELLPTRAPREESRPGAPFWLLVDFDAELGESERAGIEGALEGAGVLDAWVLPDGSVLAAGSDDVVLVPSLIGVGGTLAEHLSAAPGELPVAPAIIEQLLRSIGVGRSEEQGFVVSLDGGYAFGPARGRHPKERAQFIGAAARAENRARRLAEIGAALGELDRAGEVVARERTTLAERRRQAGIEQRSFPSEQDVRQAHAVHVSASLDADAARRAFEAAERVAIDAEREADLKRGEVEIVARRYGLDPSGSEQSLKLAAEQIDRYTDGLGSLREADYARRVALQMVEQLVVDVADAVHRRDRQTEEVEIADAAVRAAEGQLDGLHALSEGAERALELAEGLKEGIRATERREKELSRKQNEMTGRAATLASQAEHAAEKVEEAKAKSVTAIAELRAYVRADLLALALGDRGLAPPRDQALAWDAGGWLSFFNGVKQEALATRGGLEHLINTLDNDYQTLSQQVDARQLRISKERVDGLLIVRGFTHGAEQPLASLIDALTAEVDESERRLSEEDRRLFEEFVTGGLAEHLHLRINEAKETVGRMNEEIAKVQASSGMSIEVRWQRAHEGSPTHRRALELLQASPSRLTPSEQRELQEFIREQVRTARLESEENETTLAQLGKALDYRNWHTFKLRKSNTSRGVESRDLTKHEHDTGSGGEKAISLHLPLLAAAASYPASGKSDALRMVMLDEAFTRIDEEGRRAIMGLIAKFDLDVMLTSPDFWGCYAEVPELSIYALAPHDDRFPGVASRRFHWDGERKRPLDEVPAAVAVIKPPRKDPAPRPTPLEFFDGGKLREAPPEP